LYSACSLENRNSVIYQMHVAFLPLNLTELSTSFLDFKKALVVDKELIGAHKLSNGNAFPCQT